MNPRPALAASNREPEGPSMDLDASHLRDREAVSGEKAIERGGGEVAEVLVVDRVELAAIEHLLYVGDLDHRNSVGAEEPGDSVDEATQVSDVRQDVVGV